jgi:precorrin-6B methylase 2
MSLGELRAKLNTLYGSVDALAAVATALDAQIRAAPQSAEASAVTHAMGLHETIRSAPPENLEPILAQIRAFMLTSARLVATPECNSWTFTDPLILESAGMVSAAFPALMRQKVLPRLAGMEAKLDAGASFLEVGSGVSAMSVAMAKLWPRLNIVGLEPLPAALALAHARVESAGLHERIELRRTRAEHVTDQDRFDLAWMPSLFIPASQLPAAVKRVHAALKPEGWIMLAALRPSDDALQTALSRFRAASFGGFAGSLDDAVSIVSAAGFRQVDALPSEAGSVTALIIAQK